MPRCYRHDPSLYTDRVPTLRSSEEGPSQVILLCSAHCSILPLSGTFLGTTILWGRLGTCLPGSGRSLNWEKEGRLGLKSASDLLCGLGRTCSFSEPGLRRGLNCFHKYFVNACCDPRALMGGAEDTVRARQTRWGAQFMDKKTHKTRLTKITS